MLQKWVGSIVAALLTLALLIGCGGNPAQTSPQDSEDLAGTSTGFSIPAPSEIHIASDASSSPWKYGDEYEKDLPSQRVSTTSGETSLKFQPLAESDFTSCAYAVYRLHLPECDDWPGILIESTGESGVWLAFANFKKDSWDWEILGTTTKQHPYDPSQSVLNDELLIAIVATSPTTVEWLVAGYATKPFVKEVTPLLMRTGSQMQFSATMMRYSQSETFFWNFGGGVQPNVSEAEDPEITALAPGNYTGTLTTENVLGEEVYEFTYRIIDSNSVPPLHLQAIPDKTAVLVNEPIVITIKCGDFPQDKQMRDGWITLLTSDHASYVPGSFNVGSPGGAQYELDGLWAIQQYPPYGWLPVVDAWLEFEVLEATGKAKLTLAATPVLSSNTTLGGDFLNFAISYSEPGIYELDFLLTEGLLRRTVYKDESNIQYDWDDISNDFAPVITVTE